jgi:hypothetical protein
MIRNRSLVLGLSLALTAGLTACGDDAPVDSPPDAQPDGASSALHGTVIDHHDLEGGEVDHPIDLTASTITAAIPDGNGGFELRSGVGAADGTFTVADVPEGVTYYLRVDDTWLVTDARTIDLGSDRAGRPDGVAVTDPDTQITFDLGGMTPWGYTDHLQLFSRNAGIANSYVLFPPDGELAPGQTEIAATLGYLDLARPPIRIDASAGDRAVVNHLVGHWIDDFDYRILGERAEAAPFTVTEGTSTLVAGAFQPVPADQSGHLRLPYADYRALGPAGAEYPPVADVAFFAQPKPLANGLSPSPVTLFETAQPTDLDDVDVEIPFGNPFDASWETFGTVFVTYQGEIPVPGATSVPIAGGVGSYRALDELFAGDNALPISQVGHPTIAGEDASVEQTGVGLTPVLAWEAPLVGSVNGYRIRIVRIYAGDNNGGRQQPVATIYSRDTELTIPPGVLEAGERYYIQIAAWDEPNRDFAAAPNRLTIPTSVAHLPTAAFSP